MNENYVQGQPGNERPRILLCLVQPSKARDPNKRFLFELNKSHLLCLDKRRRPYPKAICLSQTKCCFAHGAAAILFQLNKSQWRCLHGGAKGAVSKNGFLRQTNFSFAYGAGAICFGSTTGNRFAFKHLHLPKAFVQVKLLPSPAAKKQLVKFVPPPSPQNKGPQ